MLKEVIKKCIIVMEKLVNKLNNQLSKTKTHVDNYRPVYALNRDSAGFTAKMKELTFTLVSDRAEGVYIYDLDDNKYIDLTMGFGSLLFGHNNKEIKEVIKDQLNISWSVGAMSPLAGELAKQLCEVTNNERVAFFNTGTEAVMVALRLAKAATQKKHFVFFKVAYHGTFDPLLSMKTDADGQAKEMVPGVTQNILNESYIFEYGSQEGLDFIKNNKDKIAAVLVEPVQSRRPNLVLVDFLKSLRELCDNGNMCLVFDEVITGFRSGIGGAQELFGIQADIVTYGKVIGGGLPIGIVAGKAKYLDYTDGGTWQFGDDSKPESSMTFVAGTFCQHPLAMRSALKTLEMLKSKPELTNDLNRKTLGFCTRMNEYFTDMNSKIRLVSFSSLFRFNTPGNARNIYHYLLYNKVYIWEGRNCFFSTAHDDQIIAELEERIKTSFQQMQNQISL